MSRLLGLCSKRQSLKAHSRPQDASLKTPTTLAYNNGSLGLYCCDLFCKATNSRLNLLSASAQHALWFRILPDLPVPRTAFSVVLTLPQASALLSSAAMLGVLRAFVLDAVATELAPALQTGALLELTPIASGLQISLEAWSEGFSHLTQILFGPSKLPCHLLAPIPRAPPQRQLPPGQSNYTTPITGSVASSEVTLSRLAAFSGLQRTGPWPRIRPII